jgi:hypothetical protein
VGRIIVGAQTIALALALAVSALANAAEESTPAPLGAPEETKQAFAWDLHWDRGVHYELRQRVSVDALDRLIPYRLLHEEVALQGKITHVRARQGRGGPHRS